MDNSVNLTFFSHPEIVLDYARAAINVGLWNSEKQLCKTFIARDAEILELGAGAGRVSLGLVREGYSKITVTDFAPPMVEIAQTIFEDAAIPANASIRFAVEDATQISFPQNSFDAVIFAFNGLQMIPKQARRELAIREISRILRPGGVFIFTGHDQTHAARREHWDSERSRWENNERDPALDDFGDYNHATPQGAMFIHAAVPAQMRQTLEANGFEVEFSELRSRFATEPPAVLDFSDDTRFWVARKCSRNSHGNGEI